MHLIIKKEITIKVSNNDAQVGKGKGRVTL